MTIYNFLLKSNIRFTLHDTEVLGTKAAVVARDKGVRFTKVIEKPWHKKQKKPYLANDFPETFADEMINLVLEHFVGMQSK
ncbi:MAG: hypothetical protein ABI772_13115 [Bacteroidota bacterium]